MYSERKRQKLLVEEKPLKLEDTVEEREVELTGEGAAELAVVSSVGQWRWSLGGRWLGWSLFFFFFQTIRVKEGLDSMFC